MIPTSTNVTLQSSVSTGGFERHLWHLPVGFRPRVTCPPAQTPGNRGDVYSIAIIVLGALGGGFVTGLAGFGTGLTALGFWLHVVDPVVASAVVVICSVVGQAQSLYTVRRAVSWGVPGPFSSGGWSACRWVWPRCESWSRGP